MPLRMPRRAGLLLDTGQTTCYHIGGDGGLQKGLAKRYEILTVGQHAGTVNLDVASYAAATIAFAATTPGTITDAANGLAHILTGDTLVVKGSASNDGVYTVSTGGVAGTIRTTEATLLEGAALYVSLYKRTTHSNNGVQDMNTGLMWARYTSSAEKVGTASTGTLNWYDAATCFTLHPAAADLAMVAGNILRVVGSDESTRYHVGDVLVCSGFANAVNNLPGLTVLSCSFAGGNTDIVVDPGNQTLIVEVAGGARAIKLVSRSIFGYAAAARAASLGGYTDWRVPNLFAFCSIANLEVPTAAPDAVAFPGWPVGKVHTATTRTDDITRTLAFIDAYVLSSGTLKTEASFAALVRGS